MTLRDKYLEAATHALNWYGWDEPVPTIRVKATDLVELLAYDELKDYIVQHEANMPEDDAYYVGIVEGLKLAYSILTGEENAAE